MRRFSLRVRIVLLTFVALLPFVILPKTQTAIVRQWEPRLGGPVRQRLLWTWLASASGFAMHGLEMFLSTDPEALASERLEAPARVVDERAVREFRLDKSGRITQLRLRNAGLDRLDRLPGFGDLTSIERLDLSHNPLIGRIDLSRLSRLRQVDLSHSRLDAVRPLPPAVTSLSIRDAGLTTTNRIERQHRSAHLVHSAQPHHGERPRVLAQPAVLPVDPGNRPRPNGDPNVVERVTAPALARASRYLTPAANTWRSKKLDIRPNQSRSVAALLNPCASLG
jgi:hypothetical protein